LALRALEEGNLLKNRFKVQRLRFKVTKAGMLEGKEAGRQWRGTPTEGSKLRGGIPLSVGSQSEIPPQRNSLQIPQGRRGKESSEK
jgi:hypothetical protein